ncbi:MAG: hypothetical protein ACOVMN_09600 [Flexibacteraceae bacterium]
MKKISLLVLLFLGLHFNSIAQKKNDAAPKLNVTQLISLDDTPVKKLPDSLSKYPLVYEFYRHYVQQEVIGMAPKESIAYYETNHTRVHLINDEALNSFNVFELEDIEDENFTQFNYRITFKNGKVKEVKNPDLLKYKNRENQSYKIPIEGLEVGAVLEILYTKKSDSFSDERHNLSFDIPILSWMYKFSYLKSSKFDIRTYNYKGTPVKTDFTSSETKASQTLEGGYLPALVKESFQNLNAIRPYIRVRQVSGPDLQQAASWSGISNVIVARMNIESEAEGKVLLKYLYKATNKKADPFEQIKTLENLLKTDLQYKPGYLLEPFNTCKEAGKASEFSLLRFYTIVAKKLGLNYKLGFTISRSDGILDTEFPSFDFARTFFLYFPNENQYLFPGSILYRVGDMDEEIISQKSVFIQEFEINGAQGVKFNFDTIPMPKTLVKIIDLNCKVTADLKTLTTKTDVFEVYKGSDAEFWRLNHKRNSFEDLVKIKTSMQFSTENPGTIANLAFKNIDPKPTEFRVPLEVNYTATLPNSIEKIEDDYLVNLGWVIGTQTSLPKSEPRVSPVDPTESKTYNRVIELTIPEGYTVTGYEKEVKKISYRNGTLFYESKAEVKGNVLVITNTETYNSNIMPASAYLQYEEVMNAAAYLNNLKVLFKKK